MNTKSKENNFTIKLSEKEKIMRYASPAKALIIYSIPTIVIMLIFSLYSLVDKVLAQMFAGENLLHNSTILKYWYSDHSTTPTLEDMRGYINIATQYSYVIFNLGGAFASLLSIGTSIVYAIEYGKRNYKAMGEIFANSIVYNILFSIVVCVLLFFLSSPTFGAVLIDVQEGGNYNAISTYLTWHYVFIFIIFLPLFFISYLFTTIIRSQGRTWETITITITSLLLNVFLDWIFIYYGKLDLNGAMLATGVSWIYNIIFVILIMKFEKQKNLRFSRKYFRMNLKILKSIFPLGLTGFFIRTSNAVFSIISAYLITMIHGSPMSGDLYLLQELSASLMPWILILLNVLIGGSQGARVVLAYSYGAKKYLRIKKAIFWTFIGISVWIIFCTVIITIFGSKLITMFAFPSEYAKQYHIYVILYIIAYPCFAITYTLITLFTSIKKTITSIILSLLRSFVVLVAMAIIGFFLSNYVYDHVTTKNPGLIYFLMCGLNDLVVMLISIPIIWSFWRKNKTKIIDHEDEEISVVSSIDEKINENVKVTSTVSIDVEEETNQ